MRFFFAKPCPLTPIFTSDREKKTVVGGPRSQGSTVTPVVRRRSVKGVKRWQSHQRLLLATAAQTSYIVLLPGAPYLRATEETAPSKSLAVYLRKLHAARVLGKEKTNDWGTFQEGRLLNPVYEFRQGKRLKRLSKARKQRYTPRSHSLLHAFYFV